MALISFTAPDVAIVAEVPAGTAFVSIIPDQVYDFDDAVFVSSNTYSTLSAALTAAQAIDPSVPPEVVYGDLNVSQVSTSADFEVLAGDPVTIQVEFTSTDSGVSRTYQWRKNQQEIYGATTDTLQGTYGVEMDGSYDCLVTSSQASTGRSRTDACLPYRIKTKTPPLYAADAIGGVDPYGIINTGRGGGIGSGGPDDLNPSFITLIDNTYTVNQLELYVPTTSTVISYDGGLSAPFTFDSAGNCFNGTDYEIEIRVAATSLVLATITVPLTETNESIYWYD